MGVFEFFGALWLFEVGSPFPPKNEKSALKFLRSDQGPIFSELPDPDLVLNEADPQPWF